MIVFLAKYRLLHIIIGAVLALAVLLIPKLYLVGIFVVLGAIFLVPEIDAELKSATRTVEFPNKWLAAGAMDRRAGQCHSTGAPGSSSASRRAIAATCSRTSAGV